MSNEKITHEILVANEIEKYLDHHPNAADTLEGILKWWIYRIRVEEAAVTVSKALEILEREDKLEKTVTVDGKEIYRRPK